MSDDDVELRVVPLQPEALLRALVDHVVRFVVIGGFSLAAHGVVRATKDIDIVPEPVSSNLRRLAAALTALDAELLLADDFDSRELGITHDEQGLALGGNWVLRTRFGRLDIMQDVAGANGYEALRARAVVYDVPGAGEVCFAGVDDLIAMKSAANRPQDRLDIAELERARRSR